MDGDEGEQEAYAVDMEPDGMMTMTNDEDIGFLRKMKRNPVAKVLRQNGDLRPRVAPDIKKYNRNKFRNWRNEE